MANRRERRPEGLNLTLRWATGFRRRVGVTFILFELVIDLQRVDVTAIVRRTPATD